MLNTETIKKIEDFVYKEPKSVQEIAVHLNKNWRTVDRYITQIIDEKATSLLKHLEKEPGGH